MTPQHGTLELNITGLDCPNCANHLESILKGTTGVTKVTTLLAERTAIILYDPAKTTPDQIREGIEEAGYTVVSGEKEESGIETAPATQEMAIDNWWGNDNPSTTIFDARNEPDIGLVLLEPFSNKRISWQ